MAEQQGAQRFYTVQEAADYLGVALRTFQYYLYDLRLVQPDGYVSNHAWFKRETLDALRRTLEQRAAGRWYFEDAQGERLYTVGQGARLIGMKVATLSYHHREGNVTPDEVRDGRALFYEETLRRFHATRRPEGRPSKGAAA